MDSPESNQDHSFHSSHQERLTLHEQRVFPKKRKKYHHLGRWLILSDIILLCFIFLGVHYFQKPELFSIELSSDQLSQHGKVFLRLSRNDPQREPWLIKVSDQANEKTYFLEASQDEIIIEWPSSLTTNRLLLHFVSSSQKYQKELILP